MSKLLTIAISSYNVSEFLVELLDDIQIQLRNLNMAERVEVLIIDDGSTDGTGEILAKKYANQFKIIQQANQGLSSVRNRSIELASGEYLWMIDGDDLIYDHAIELILNSLEGYRKNILRIGYNNNVFDLNSGEYDSKLDQSVFDDFLRGKLKSYTWQFIFKSTFVKSVGRFVDGIKYEDLEFAPKFLVNEKETNFLSGPLYRYRIRQNSIVHTTDESAVKSLVLIKQSWEQVQSNKSRKEKLIFLANTIGAQLAYDAALEEKYPNFKNDLNAFDVVKMGEGLNYRFWLKFFIAEYPLFRRLILTVKTTLQK